MGVYDQPWRVLPDLGKGWSPFGDRHVDGLKQADLQAVLAGFVLYGVGDIDAVSPGTGDDRDFVVRPLPLP